MWFITLMILALAAYLIIKAVKAQAARKALDEAQRVQNSGITGTLQRDSLASQSTGQPQTADDTFESAGPADNDVVVDESTDAGLPNTATKVTAAASAGAVKANTADSDTSTTADQPGSAESELGTEDQLTEIREMLKTLDLTESDADQLGIDREQFNALKSGDDADVSTATLPSRDAQIEIAGKLRRMLA